MALSNVLFSGWHPVPVIACSKGKLPSTVIRFLFFYKVILTTFVLLFHLHCFCFLQLFVLMLKKTLTRQTAYDGRSPASPSLDPGQNCDLLIPGKVFLVSLNPDSRCAISPCLNSYFLPFSVDLNIIQYVYYSLASSLPTC